MRLSDLVSSPHDVPSVGSARPRSPESSFWYCPTSVADCAAWLRCTSRRVASEVRVLHRDGAGSVSRSGSRLGAMLFADRGMQRGVVELARIRPRETLYTDAVRDPSQARGDIWGRRSIFRLAHKPLLVSEIFLPDFPAGEVARLPRENR